MIKHSLMASAILFAFSNVASAAAVKVSADAADGYGLYLDLSAQVNAKLLGSVTVGTASVEVKTPTALGDISVASAGTPIPRQTNSTLNLGLSASGTGTGVLSSLNPILALLTPTQVGSATFSGSGAYLENNPVPGSNSAIGTGSVEHLNVSVSTALALQADLIDSTSTVTVNESSGLFTASGNSTFVGANLSILGHSIDLAAAATGGVYLDLGPLGRASVFANESKYWADGIVASNCNGATFSCAVETNALQITLDEIGINSLGLLGLANLSATTDLCITVGHSYASATVTPVPEASSSLMMLLGLGALMGLSRRRL
ncbi:PEP-CTERM sorting domain-containing protein [Methylophilus sp. 14]|uniref:PEP-CTERM sorting domain-containing protein n=1 Tax=Methylophilus sp. 14 TaxID=2781019 RepID=UPI00188EE8D1|nr:PEP-CTERM sorting domain-containing protein [Methylophilus sp. 14]MBF4988641.1 PEP-CTERM sorting domain-containing protein [Methylophilus sp. 14]